MAIALCVSPSLSHCMFLFCFSFLIFFFYFIWQLLRFNFCYSFVLLFLSFTAFVVVLVAIWSLFSTLIQNIYLILCRRYISINFLCLLKCLGYLLISLCFSFYPQLPPLFLLLFLSFALSFSFTSIVIFFLFLFFFLVFFFFLEECY